MNEEAIELIVSRGKVYLNQGKYLSLKVFTTEESAAKVLKEAFRGEYYPQGKGFVWALGYLKDIERCAKEVEPHRKLYDHLDLLFDTLTKKPPS